MISLTKEQCEFVARVLRLKVEEIKSKSVSLGHLYTRAQACETLNEIAGQIERKLDDEMPQTNKWFRKHGWSSPSDPEWSKGECYPPIKPATPS